MNKIQQTGGDSLKQKCRDNGPVFGLAFAAGMLVHFPIYAYGLQNPDSIWKGEENIADWWEYTLGRWGLVLVDWLRGGLNAPVLNAAAAMALFVLASLILADVLQVRSRKARLLMTLTVICTPYLSISLTYVYCSIAYAAAFLLAVLSVFAAMRSASFWKGVLAGAVCLMFSLSIYQSNIGVAAGLSVLAVLLALIKDPASLKRQEQMLLRLVVMILAGTGLYYGILQIVLHVMNITLSSYKGASSIGSLQALAQLPHALKNAYADVFRYFFRTDIAANHYGMRIFYGLLILSAAAAFCRWTLQQPQKKAVLFAVFLILILPLGVNAIDLIAVSTRIILLTSGGMVLLIPAAVALCFLSAADAGGIRWLAAASAASAVCLLAGSCLQVNTDTMVMHANQQKTIQLVNRIYADLEHQDGFTKDSAVLITGTPELGSYPDNSRLLEKADLYAKWGMVWPTYSGSWSDWQAVFHTYAGVDLKVCSQEDYVKITASQQFQQMPVYPAAGSIQQIGWVTVVKVSGTDRFTD